LLGRGDARVALDLAQQPDGSDVLLELSAQ